MQEAGHGVWFFYGLRAKKEITRLADYALENWGEEGWTFFLQALSAVLEGNQERALTFFEKSWELDAALWEAAYNAGVIYLVQGRNIDAGNWLKKAESSVPTSDKNSIALIYTKFAEIELAAGRRDDARRYIRYALEISPANPSARSFHSMLDESYP
jgi:tetratricopeptide (TPR) repeat protein